MKIRWGRNQKKTRMAKKYTKQCEDENLLDEIYLLQEQVKGLKRRIQEYVYSGDRSDLL